MITITLQEAKAKLNQLVERALAGDDVVLMRGAKVVARIQPITENDIEISPRLTDAQAEHFWAEVREKDSKKVSGAHDAVEYLRKQG